MGMVSIAGITMRPVSSPSHSPFRTIRSTCSGAACVSVSVLLLKAGRLQAVMRLPAKHNALHSLQRCHWWEEQLTRHAAEPAILTVPVALLLEGGGVCVWPVLSGAVKSVC